jgi:predicted SAM-dependent methyltransferase
MKVQFGAGGNILQGWKNHDRDVDITKPLPYRDGTVDFILIEHCLEHVNCSDGFRFMEEALRILRPGGTLRVCVPMLERIQEVAHCRDLIVNHGHQVIYSRETLINALQIAGFETVTETDRADCDGHWRQIGEDKDALETLRVEARKAA